MQNIKKVTTVLTFLFFIFGGLYVVAFTIENYKEVPLFELKVGDGLNKFRLGFIPAPFAYEEGRKTLLCTGGTQVFVDNSGNFYLFKSRHSIVKINPQGEVIKEIKGAKGFTVPIYMELDGFDNLYVKFRNDTNIGSKFRYAVAKYDKDGNFLHWIGENNEFKCIFMDVNINGTVFLKRCGEDAAYGQFERYNSDGKFTGFLQHEELSSIPNKNGGNTSISHKAVEDMDGNLYVIKSNDLNIKKYLNFDGSLKKTTEVKPLVEKTAFPWVERVKLPFQGFDVTNNMYFGYSTKWKRVELAKNYVDISLFTDTLIWYKYDFGVEKYDTLKCISLMKKESKFLARTILRNYKGDFYEVNIYFNDPPNVTSEDHVKFYKWERIKEN